MTRINVVPVSELTRTQLQGEYHEITRVFGLVRKAQEAGRNPKIPSHYVLGKGHVTFFYDKLGFIMKRYEDLCYEMMERGYNVNVIGGITEGIDKKWFNDYFPTEEAKQLNKQRFKERDEANELKRLSKK